MSQQHHQRFINETMLQTSTQSSTPNLSPQLPLQPQWQSNPIQLQSIPMIQSNPMLQFTTLPSSPPLGFQPTFTQSAPQFLPQIPVQQFQQNPIQRQWSGELKQEEMKQEIDQQLVKLNQQLEIRHSFIVCLLTLWQFGCLGCNTGYHYVTSTHTTSDFEC